jgi:hypothetical protein
VQLHRDARVEVRPLSVSAENLDVQPEVAVDMRVERPGSAVLELDDLDPRYVLPDEPAMPAPRVELGLPGEQDALTQPVLESLELARELGMQQRRDAVGLRVVERPIEQQVGVRAQPLVASLLPRDWVVPGEPDTKSAGCELVGRDDAVVDDEPRER